MKTKYVKKKKSIMSAIGKEVGGQEVHEVYSMQTYFYSVLPYTLSALFVYSIT